MFFNAIVCTETVLFFRLCFVKLFFNPSKDHISKCLVKQPQRSNRPEICGLQSTFENSFFAKSRGQRQSPISHWMLQAGHPRMRGGQYRGTALRDARRNKERTYPELLRDRRCRLVVFGIEVGGRWSDEAATFLRLPPTPKLAKLQPFCATPSPTPWSTAGAQCSRTRPCMPSQHPSLTKTYQAVTTLKATPPPSVRSSLKPPAPPTTADSQPPRKETGLDFALSYAHPGAARIKMTSIVRAHMPGDRSVKQFLLLNLLRSKRRGEKKNKKEGNKILWQAVFIRRFVPS